MQRTKRVALIVVLLVCCVGCDQTTKSLAKQQLQGRETITFLSGIVRLQYVENPGAFLSLGASLPRRWRSAIFTIGAGAALLAALGYAFTVSTASRLEIVAPSLIGGGGIGNLTDRILHDGYVADFLNVGIGSLRTGIFNMADVALMIGVALLVLGRRRTLVPH